MSTLIGATRAIARTGGSRAIIILRAASSSSEQQPATATARPKKRPLPVATATGLPGSNIPLPSSTTGATGTTQAQGQSKKEYSPLTVSVVTALARAFGYNKQGSTAIRTTSEYYDRVAERAELEAQFFYEECSLPPSFQTWFSVTVLHVWLLSLRFRSLPPPLGRLYIQELINHFFIDMELRIRGPYEVTKGRLIKGYMRDLLEQYHGSIAAYDEGLVKGDPELAAAIWRNMFGGGWGGVGGVKGKRAPKAGVAPEVGINPNPWGLEERPKPISPRDARKAAAKAKAAEVAAKASNSSNANTKKEEEFTTDEPVLDPSLASKQHSFTLNYPSEPDLEFLPTLEKLVRFVRCEVDRMERLEDIRVTNGLLEKGLMEWSEIGRGLPPSKK